MNNQPALIDKVALVLGGSRGIGAAIVRRLAAEGAAVALTYANSAESAAETARAVFDVVAFPAETPLVRAARAADKPVITGAEVIALQAARQFELYTGVSISADQVERASAFSRESAGS